MARPTTNDEQVAERLIDAAIELLGGTAPDELSVRLVAQKAGTSAAAIYTLFGGREQLVTAIANVVAASLHDALTALPETADPRADVRALGLAYVAWAREHPHLYATLFVGTTELVLASSPLPGNPARPVVMAIDRAVAGGVLAGEAPVIAATLMAGLHGLALFWVHRAIDPASLQAAGPALVDALLQGWAAGQ